MLSENINGNAALCDHWCKLFAAAHGADQVPRLQARIEAQHALTPLRHSWSVQEEDMMMTLRTYHDVYH